jgi:hypothetical protein
MYSIMLTKISLLHRDYLFKYASGKVLPARFLEHIDQARNCEDIAMAYLVAVEVEDTI